MCLSKYRCHVSSHAGYEKPALLKWSLSTSLQNTLPRHRHSELLFIVSTLEHTILQPGSWSTWSSLEQERTSHLTKLPRWWVFSMGEYQAYVAERTRAHGSGMCYKCSTAHSLSDLQNQHKECVRSSSLPSWSWKPRGTLALSDLHRGCSNFSVRSLQTASSVLTDISSDQAEESLRASSCWHQQFRQLQFLGKEMLHVLKPQRQTH